MQPMHGARQRKSERHIVAVDALVRRSDGRMEPVTLSDFSNEGCRIEGAGKFRVGERLQISIPRMGHVKAQVRWALQESAGARFIVESDF